MNIINFTKVLDTIKAHPETWNQAKWHCGTTHCFAGHAQILAGHEPDVGTVIYDAMKFLGISSIDEGWLFYSYRTLSDFEVFLATYDQYTEGYDKDGFDRDGYDKDGFDRDGYNCGE